MMIFIKREVQLKRFLHLLFAIAICSFILPVKFSSVIAAPLFEENFDDTNFASRGWYDNLNLQLSTTEHAPESTSSVEYRFSQGAQTAPSGGAIRKKITETDSVYVTYYVKYSANWEGSNRSYHPHEFFILTNENGDWSGLSYTHLTAYIEQNEGTPILALQDSQNVDTSNINSDLTAITENRSVAGCNGVNGIINTDYTRADCYLNGSEWRNEIVWRANGNYFQDSPGQYYKNDWHKIEAYFQMNTITTGIGNTDGIVQYWYDDQLIIDHHNVVFRTGLHPNMQFDMLAIGPYIGDGSPIEQTMWIDNLIVATSRPVSVIRPMPPTDVTVE